MSAPRILLPVLALVAGTQIPTHASQPATPLQPLTPSPTAQRHPRDLWKDNFLAAVKIGAQSEIKRLMKNEQELAIYWIMDTAKRISIRPSDALEVEMTALRKGWKTAMESEFADEIYTYYSLLDAVQKRQHTKLDARYEVARSRYGRNVADNKPEVYLVLYEELANVAMQFKDVGDHYWCSQSWVLAYNCVNRNALGDDADLYKACIAMKEAVAARLKVDLKDHTYNECAATYGVLKNQGYDGDPNAVTPEGEPAGPAPSGPAVVEPSAVYQMGFELFTDIGGVDRPSYFNDELHGLWQQARLTTKGSTIRIPSLGETSPAFLRTGSAEVWVDVDNDGKGDVAVPLRGKIDPLEFTIGEGAAKRQWGCLLTTGTSSDMYQGIQMNMNPDDNQMMLYLNPAASVVGQIGEHSVRVIDENMDGIYGSTPRVWNYDGLTADRSHPRIDSVVVDGAKYAMPWSEYQKIGDKWYRFELEQEGMALRGFETEIKTGTIKLNFKGGKPSWVIVQGVGKYENSYFDLLQKDLELPVGNWKLFCGELRKGKKVQTMKALILPGATNHPWTVVEGGETKAELGGPFGFDFKVDDEGDKLTVNGNSIVVTGQHGERYERAWNCVARPEAAWRKEGDRKGSKPQKFKMVSSQEQITAANSWAIAWFPVDLDLDKKGVTEAAEVQLTEKKNKLFGKISSEWK